METKRIVLGSETNDDRKIDLDSLGSKIALPVSLYDSTGAQVSSFGTSTPTSVGDGRKVTVSAGTAVALGSSTTISKVTVQALDTNTDVIVVGGSTVIAASGTRRGIALLPYNSIVIQVDNLTDVYIDSVVSGNGVSFIYEV